ncbi:MAG: hypothetical protein K5829_05795 [Treponema sp.]|nr:hypothetical protein [Treponema sp.]
MKRIIILSLAITFLFAGCASKQAPEEVEVPEPETTVTPEEEVVTSESIPEEELIPSKYDDWKYKGFGTELPDWFDLAIEYDDSGIKNILEISPDSLIRIVCTEGKDVDQCEQKLNEIAEEFSYDFEILNSCWARKNPLVEEVEEPYVSVRIYISNDGVMEISDN